MGDRAGDSSRACFRRGGPDAGQQLDDCVQQAGCGPRVTGVVSNESEDAWDERRQAMDTRATCYSPQQPTAQRQRTCSILPPLPLPPPPPPPPLPTAMQSFASQLAPQRRHTPPTQAPASASPVRRGSPPHGRPSIACDLSNTSVLVAACWHGTARLPATGRCSCIFQPAAGSRCKYWRRLTKCARGLTCWACVRECAQPLQPRPRSPIASCIP